MSEEARLGLVRRVASALLCLEALSDGKTAKIDPNKVHGGEGGGLQLLRDKTPLEFHQAELEEWCRRAEDRTSKERKRIPTPMTRLQEDFWFLEEWEGKDYHTVADRYEGPNGEKLTPDEVWRKRERSGRNGKDGRSLEQAA